MTLPQPKVWFGVSLGDWSGAYVLRVDEVVRRVVRADADGLDLFTVADHPYFGSRLDAYTVVGFGLGRTERITGVVSVTNAVRPPILLARTLGSLAELSGGRVIFGIGAGAIWDHIEGLGAERLSPAQAVTAMADTITKVRALCGGGGWGEIEPMPVPAPPVWTGSVGPRSLAVTGRLADGWIPSRGADWLSASYRESRPRIDEAAVAAGRDPAEIVSVFNFGGPITDSPRSPARDADGRWAGGSVKQWVGEMTSAVTEHGASGFIYRPPEDEPPEVAIGRWTREIVPAVRDAICPR